MNPATELRDKLRVLYPKQPGAYVSFTDGDFVGSEVVIRIDDIKVEAPDVDTALAMLAAGLKEKEDHAKT